MTATSAHAGTWQFTSGDALNDDAIVSGFFTGTDTNNDGRLTEPELSTWQFDFSPGSTGLEPFSLQSTQPSDVLLFFLYNFAMTL